MIYKTTKEPDGSIKVSDRFSKRPLPPGEAEWVACYLTRGESKTPLRSADEVARMQEVEQTFSSEEFRLATRKCLTDGANFVGATA